MAKLKKCPRCGKIDWFTYDEFDFGIKNHKCRKENNTSGKKHNNRIKQAHIDRFLKSLSPLSSAEFGRPPLMLLC